MHQWPLLCQLCQLQTSQVWTTTISGDGTSLIRTQERCPISLVSGSHWYQYYFPLFKAEMMNTGMQLEYPILGVDSNLGIR